LKGGQPENLPINVCLSCLNTFNICYWYLVFSLFNFYLSPNVLGRKSRRLTCPPLALLDIDLRKSTFFLCSIN
jgi:hypothetical protein